MKNNVVVQQISASEDWIIRRRINKNFVEVKTTEKSGLIDNSLFKKYNQTVTVVEMDALRAKIIVSHYLQRIKDELKALEEGYDNAFWIALFEATFPALCSLLYFSCTLIGFALLVNKAVEVKSQQQDDEDDLLTGSNTNDIGLQQGPSDGFDTDFPATDSDDKSTGASGDWIAGIFFYCFFTVPVMCVCLYLSLKGCRSDIGKVNESKIEYYNKLKESGRIEHLFNCVNLCIIDEDKPSYDPKNTFEHQIKCLRLAIVEIQKSVNEFVEPGVGVTILSALTSDKLIAMANEIINPDGLGLDYTSNNDSSIQCV